MVMAIFLLWLALLASHPLQAATCGGSLPCSCGDTVTQDYNLTANLGPCPGHGLLVASGVTLDGQGYHILGPQDGSEAYGIYLRGSTGATVKNVVVSGFRHGIRLRDAHGNKILDSKIFQNGNFTTHAGYGIDLAKGSSHNTLQGNSIHNNADEGIHFGSGSSYNALVSNRVYDNFRENIYLLSSHNNTLTDNTVWGGKNSLYVKDSSFNLLAQNTLRDAPVLIRGDSHDNILSSNDLIATGIHFQVYTKASPPRHPHHNTLIGGTIGGASTCLRFSSSWGNRVVDTVLSACKTSVESNGSRASSRNTLIGVPLGKVKLDSRSSLDIGWHLEVRVQDENGLPLSGAQVRALDSSGSVLFDLLSDGSGAIPTQDVVAYTLLSSGKTSYSPLTLEVSHPGYETDSRQIDLTENTAVTFTLKSLLPSNSPPTADAGPNREVEAGEVLSLDGTGSTDPDGDPLTFSWDLADGTYAQGAVVSHTYPNPGTYVVSLTVDDGRGGTDTDTVLITVHNSSAPTPLQATLLTPAAPVSLMVGESLAFEGSASGGIPPYTFTWNFPGSTPSSASGPGPHSRTYSAAGVYTASLTVSDAATPPNTDTATVRVEVQDREGSLTIIDGPVWVSSGAVLSYAGTVVVQDEGIFQAKFAKGNFTLQVDGDLILEAGATRIRTSKKNLTGSVTLDVTGRVVIRGTLDASGTRWGGTDGGSVTILCSDFLLEDGGLIDSRGGKNRGRAGAITILATRNILLQGKGTLRATAAYGGDIQLAGDVIGGSGGILKATGKKPSYTGTITLSYYTSLDASNMSLNPDPTVEHLGP